MAIRTVDWIISEHIPCHAALNCNQEVRLCVAPSLVVDDSPTIVATFKCNTNTFSECGYRMKYTFEYDDEQLKNPEEPLKSSQILSVISDLCLIRFIEYQSVE